MLYLFSMFYHVHSVRNTHSPNVSDSFANLANERIGWPRLKAPRTQELGYSVPNATKAPKFWLFFKFN